jgi:glycosyltransferase involved in cell wall biosynthesis
MWLKWLPWKFVVSRVARAHGFLDPVSILSHLHRFVQPSEVAEPIELLRVEVELEFHQPICRIQLNAYANSKAWAVVSLRPYNPEGVSFIHEVALQSDGKTWIIHGRPSVEFSIPVERHRLSDYRSGDVHIDLPLPGQQNSVKCGVGMATAAALFELQPDQPREIIVGIPLHEHSRSRALVSFGSGAQAWQEALRGHCELRVPDERFQFLYDVARSVEAFMAEYQKLGHDVLVVAPVFEGMPKKEANVIRVPAIQKFNGSDFSVRLPIPGFLFPSLDRFRPDVVHSHHPFLLADTALRVAALRNVPLVFTHHTMYEQYTHYVPGDSPALKRFVVELCTGYANLCDQVIAPSESIASILCEQGVKVPIVVIPTGVDIQRFAQGDGVKFRKAMGIPSDAFVVGHLGRLAPEKNLMFLCEGVAAFLKKNKNAYFLVVGVGPLEEEIRGLFKKEAMAARLHQVGILRGRELADAYHAMDLFAFASRSETQGMVLTEAMAAGVPAVAVDAPGVREVLIDGYNGRLLSTEDIREFVSTLSWFASLSAMERKVYSAGARETAERFSLARSAAKALDLYRYLLATGQGHRKREESLWATTLRLVEREWELWVNRVHAAGAVFARSKVNDKEPE